MTEVIFDKNGTFAKKDENLCGQCARKGCCPLKEAFKRTGVLDDISRTLFCGYYAPEQAGV